MGSGWRKFAILGSTYARALGNAAGRAGRDVGAMQPALSNIAQQPLAKLRPGMSSFMREPGALTPTAPQQDMQKMLAKVPWAGSDHAGSPHAESTLNTMLKRRGLDSNTPAGQPNVNEQIAKNFGPPKTNREAPPQADVKTRRTNVQPGVPHEPRDGNIWDLMDHNPKVPGRLGLPSMDTHVGPAPAPRPGQAPTTLGHQMPAAPPANVGENTQVSHGQWAPPWQRARARAAPLPPIRSASPIAGQSIGAGANTSVLKAGSALSTAAGIGLPLAIGGGMLLNKPGIKADIADRFHNQGDIHQKDMNAAIPDEVQGQATHVSQALAARGINPTGLRMAVDAPSGAGKTVLSKAIAGQLGLRHHGLDWRPNMRLHQLMGGRDIEKTPYAPHAGEILEHQQLLRSYDPELFDVAIHIHKDPNAIKQQVLQRGRGARTTDLLDYDKSIGVGQKAFETLGGESIDLGGGAFMKIRPNEGWGNALDEQLAAAGIDTTGLSRHEKLLSLHSGQRTTGAGWTPYIRNPFSGGEMAAMGASVPLGVMAAKALARRRL